jgi:hypothetical protein
LIELQIVNFAHPRVGSVGAHEAELIANHDRRVRVFVQQPPDPEGRGILPVAPPIMRLRNMLFAFIRLETRSVRR